MNTPPPTRRITNVRKRQHAHDALITVRNIDHHCEQMMARDDLDASFLPDLYHNLHHLARAVRIINGDVSA